MDKKKIGIVYMPILHKGYFDFIAVLKKKGVEKVCVVSDEILEAHEELDYINRKDRLRALPTELIIKSILDTTGLETILLNNRSLSQLQIEDVEIHAPREDINEFLIQNYFSKNEVVFHDVFLRWNKSNAEKICESHQELDITEFQKSIFSNVLEESLRSTDWWRQVGAALVKNGSLIALAHNEHMPEKELPNIFGDTRALYKKGINIHYVTSAHAEVGVIGEAAKKGVSTQGAELYVTDFPCPYCARLIVKAGISKVYYIKGYGVLDGENFLEEMHVETIKVSV